MYNVTFEQCINYIAKILRISVLAGEAEPSFFQIFKNILFIHIWPFSFVEETIYFKKSYKIPRFNQSYIAPPQGLFVRLLRTYL